MTTEAMRAEFEACFADCNLRRVSDRSDCYESTSTAALWEGYQAALRSPAVAGLVEATKLADQFFDGDDNHWQWDDGEGFPASRIRAALANFTGESHG